MEFSEGLEKIGVAAFSESGIRRVDLPSSTRRIGGEAFTKCVDLCSVRLNKGLETLGEAGRYGNKEFKGNAFSHSALESIVIPSTLEVLEEHTFYCCEKLTNIVFTESSRLREIGKGCFALTALKAFEAPPSLRKIGNRAFYFCRGLQYVVLNEGLEAVGTDDEEFRS